MALLSGATAVDGPGVKLVVDDAKDAERRAVAARASPPASPTPGGCATATCSAWSTGCGQSGAEAISINGQRLTALSAIRAAGDAILVDNRPLVPPYTVLAVGDGKQLSHGLPGQCRRPVPAGAAGELRHPHQHLRAGRGPASGRAQPDRTYSRAAGRRHGQWCGRHREGHIVIAVLGLVVGVVVGLFVRPEVPAVVEPYLPIAVVAALDAVFGGLRAMLDGIFVDKVFVVSFLSNVVVAALIVFLGDKLGVGRPALHRCGRRPRHPDLLQRRRHPPARLPGVRPMSNGMSNEQNPDDGRQPRTRIRARQRGTRRRAPAGSARSTRARPRSRLRRPGRSEASGRQRLRAGLWPPRVSEPNSSWRSCCSSSVWAWPSRSGRTATTAPCAGPARRTWSASSTSSTTGPSASRTRSSASTTSARNWRTAPTRRRRPASRRSRRSGSSVSWQVPSPRTAPGSR